MRASSCTCRWRSPRDLGCLLVVADFTTRGPWTRPITPSGPANRPLLGSGAQNPCHEPPMDGTAVLGPPPSPPICSILCVEHHDFVSLHLALWHLGDLARAFPSSENILPLLLIEMYSFFQAQIRYFHPRKFFLMFQARFPFSVFPLITPYLHLS